jgi:hypothetical protein
VETVPEEGGRTTICGGRGSKWTPVDGEALFDGPGKTIALSDGTASFFKVTLKEPHPDTGSTGFWIAKCMKYV